MNADKRKGRVIKDEVEKIVEALPVVPLLWKRRRRTFLTIATRAILIWMAVAVVLPSSRLLACACSEVVVGGVISSSMNVDDESGDLSLIQSDIELPGIIPITLVRTYQSSTSAFGIFGPGWSVDSISYMQTTTGDIEIVFPGSQAKFLAAQGYSTEKKDLKLSFTAPDEVTVRQKDGQSWLFSSDDRTLKKYIDHNGNEVNYTWKVVSKIVGVDAENNPIQDDVFCPLSITYPDGRQLTFSYDSAGDEQYLCREISSPSGFTVSYGYTEGLLTAISKSNGQVLHYEYHKITGEKKTVGWLTKIIYANGAVVDIGYNGAFGSMEEPLRVTNITGPEGYSHTYDYQASEDGNEFTATVTDALSNSTTYWKKSFANGNHQKKIVDALEYFTLTDQDAEYLPITMVNNRGKVSSFTYDNIGVQLTEEAPVIKS